MKAFTRLCDGKQRWTAGHLTLDLRREVRGQPLTSPRPIGELPLVRYDQDTLYRGSSSDQLFFRNRNMFYSRPVMASSVRSQHALPSLLVSCIYRWVDFCTCQTSWVTLWKPVSPQNQKEISTMQKQCFIQYYSDYSKSPSVTELFYCNTIKTTVFIVLQ